MFTLWILILIIMLTICSISDIKTGYINIVVLIICVTLAVAAFVVAEFFRLFPHNTFSEIISIPLAECSNDFFPDFNEIRSGILGIIPGVIILIISKLGVKIGEGDAYIILASGFLSGLWVTMSALSLAFLLSGCYGIIRAILKREDKDKTFPFVPFIFAGYVICMVMNIIKGRLV